MRWFWICVVVVVIALALGLGLGLGLKDHFGNQSTADIENDITNYINNQNMPDFYNYQVFLALKGYAKNGLYSKANYDKLYKMSKTQKLTPADLTAFKIAP